MVTCPRTRLGIVALTLGVVACSAAAPSTPPQPSGDGPPPSQAESTPRPSPSHTEDEASPFHLDVEIRELSRDWTTPLLELASDGEAAIFSSGVLDGPEAAGAPDLWRYRPGADAPELLWRNPRRDRQLIRIGGDRTVWAFVEIGIAGERAWDLWLLPSVGADPVLLDSHPGDEDVSSLVPSFILQEGTIAWTAFDAGPAGPVSQLWIARAPEWRGQLFAERPAARAELWLPSLYGRFIAYCEVRYSADRSTDERHVYLADLDDPAAEPRRLDTSGQATMPVLHDDGVIWKETDPGFAMFNWGRLVEYDFASERITALSTVPQEYVNYPSAGLRFVAAWGADAFKFAVYDLDRRISRRIASFDPATNQSVLRPHVAGDLLVWVHSERSTTGEGPPPQARYAYLPGAGADRLEE